MAKAVSAKIDGVTIKPAKKAGLVIWVHNAWMSHPAIVALQVAGHDVRPTNEVGEPVDLILHPAAHGWQESWLTDKALKMAITWAKREKKSNAPKKA